MDYEKNFEQWLQSDELSQDEKARLRALNEEEKKKCFSARCNSARQACAVCLTLERTE